MHGDGGGDDVPNGPAAAAEAAEDNAEMPLLRPRRGRPVGSRGDKMLRRYSNLFPHVRR